jgi:putative ABC transport system permease protein
VDIKKFTKFRLVISFSIFIVLIIITNYLNFMVNNSVSNVIEYKSTSNNVGITFDELSKVKGKYKDLKLTGYREVPANVTNKYGISPEEGIKTKTVLTDENYFDLYPFEMINGGKLDFLSVKNGDKVAIISDVLAASLFKSTDIIGSTLNINEVKYKIAGVYRENKSLLYSAAEDGYERVYIPYTSYTNQDKNDSSFLDVMTTRETKNYDEKSIDIKLNKVLGDKLPLYKSVDYTVSKEIIFQNIRILYFIIGMFIIIFLIRMIAKFIREAQVFLKEKLKGNYVNEVLKNNRKEFLIFLSKISVCILGIVIIFNLVKFYPVILDKYLPSNNIFDMDFYRKTIISNIQLNNANENGVSNVYSRYISVVGNVERLMLLGELLALEATAANYRTLKLT